MGNKPRNPWIAGLLTFGTIGLGHLYSGEAKKGIFLYLGQGLLAMSLLSLLAVKINIFLLLLSVGCGLGYFLYALVDAIKTAKINSTSYSLKKYNKWYIYLACWILVCFINQLFVETLIKDTTIKAYKISAGAMLPTLQNGDYILVNKFIYKYQQPRRGDIIVFEYPQDPSKDYVKRLIGVAGDVIEIKDKRLYVNKTEQSEDYVIHQDQHTLSAADPPRDNFGPVTVPANSLFFLGDNRDSSFDSRFWGFVPTEKIRGKAITLYWSWDNESKKVRWDRIGKNIENISK